MFGYAVLFLFVLGSFVPYTLAVRELIFSVLIFRHGERERYDPLKPRARCYKHLISQGMRQLYISGRSYHDRYVKEYGLLPNKTDPSSVYFRGTYISRAMNSALCFYMGLYNHEIFHPDNSQFQNIRLPIKTTIPDHDLFKDKWIPRAIPIHTTFVNEDRLLYSYKKYMCPVMANFVKEEWMKDRAKDLAEEGMLGEEIRNHPYKHLIVNKEIVKLASHNFLTQVRNFLYLALVQNGFEVGLREKEIHEELIKRDLAFEEFLQWKHYNKLGSNLKLAVFGSHDSMIISMVNALGVEKDTRVDLAATISFELFVDFRTEDVFVEVQLNRERLPIPGCNGMCTFEQFLKAIDKYGRFETDDLYMQRCESSKFDDPLEPEYYL